MNLAKRALKVPISEIMTILGVAGAAIVYAALKMHNLQADWRSMVFTAVLISAGALIAIFLRIKREDEQPPSIR
jgi:hypothetical protein